MLVIIILVLFWAGTHFARGYLDARQLDKEDADLKMREEAARVHAEELRQRDAARRRKHKRDQELRKQFGHIPRNDDAPVEDAEFTDLPNHSSLN